MQVGIGSRPKEPPLLRMDLPFRRRARARTRVAVTGDMIHGVQDPEDGTAAVMDGAIANDESGTRSDVIYDLFSMHEV